MNAQEELADLTLHIHVALSPKVLVPQARSAAEKVLEAGYRKPRTIKTVEELDALPVGSIILDVENDAWQKMTSGSWSCADQVNGSPSGYLAATVLHVGGGGS